MLDGAFALLERSLRIAVRSPSTHLIRFGLMAAIYFAMCSAITTGIFFGAPGLHFFQGIAALDVAFVTLLGIGFFSSAITEEKEEDTLGLMLMAGISPLGILLGKSVGSLWQALILVAIQYPFMLLAITMGGVSQLQVAAVTVALLAYILLLSGFGLLCSTIAPRNRTAATLMTIGLVLYFVIPGVSKWMCWNHVRWLVKNGLVEKPSIAWAVLETVGSTCLFLQLGEILSTGFSQSAFSVQVISNSVCGVIAVGLSWLLFGLATRSPSTESNSRGLVAFRRASFRYPAGRSWTNPFVWKDFHFVSGGAGMMFVRSMYYVGLATAVYLFQRFAEPNWQEGEWIVACQVFMSMSVAVDAGLVLARSIQDEIRGQTLATLMMLPRSAVTTIYTKFAGAMLGWLPGPVIEMILTLTSERGRNEGWNLIWDINGTGLNVVSWFIMVPHIAAFVALYARWGAVPIAIGLSIGGTILVSVLHQMFLMQINYRAFATLSTMLIICICIACHIGVLLRVQFLGAK